MIVRYQGHSLTARERFQAERIALNLGERDSTATLTLSDAAPTLSVDEWISWESGPGAGIVWRVKTIDDQVEKKTRTVTVEHTIQTLRDRVLFGEITPKIISGGNSNPTARQTVVYILNQQSDWALGDIAYNVTNPYNFNGDDLFSALETVSSSLADCIWEYDFSTYPFKLYIRQMDSTVTSEMRTDRNIRTLKKTIDRSRMFTRFYPIGKNNLHINGDYVSRNENLYGTVSKVETDQSLTTKEQLTAWANERLSRHAEPAVTVTISGLELTEATGDPLDSFKIGKICRVPLPEFSTQITERVTKLSYPDVIASPMEVTVTLANELQDVAKILKEQAASGKKSNLTHAKESEEDHAWMVDTEDHIGLVAEAVAGEGAAEDWSLVASIMVDGNGIHQRVTKAEGDIITNTTAIEMNEKAITLEATARQEGDTDLSGKLTVQADRITAEVTRATTAEGTLSGRLDVTAEEITAEVTRATEAEGTLSGRITVHSDKIALVVEEKDGENVIKAASIVTAINDEGSQVAIEADHVLISGNTKLNGALTIENGALVVKKSAVFQGNVDLTTSGSYIQAGQYTVKSGGKIRYIGAGSGEYYDLTCDILKGMVKSFSVENDTLTLTPFYGDPVNFSKAASVHLTGSWSGTTFTVEDTVSGQTYSETPQYDVGIGYGQYDNIDVNTFSGMNYAHVQIKSSSTQGGNVIFGFKVDANGVWNNGYDDAKGKVELPSAGTEETFDIKVPNAARNGQDTKTFTMGQGTPGSSGYATVTLPDDYARPVVVARLSVGEWWQAGYDTARGYVSMPSAGTEDSFTVKVPNEARTGQDTKTFSLTQGSPASSGYASVSISGTVVARISIGEWWQAGYDKARSYAKMPSAGTGSSFVVKVPNAARTGSEDKTFSMTQGTPASSGYVSVSISGTVVARVSVGEWYSSGYDQAWHDFYYGKPYGTASNLWAGCWYCSTTDATHGVVAGKHYVTGPADTPSGGWAKYYCVEDIADEAGLVKSNSRSIYCSDATSEQVPNVGTVWTFTYTQSSTQNNPIVTKGSSRTVYW